MPAITRVHWGTVGARRLAGEPGTLFALWPEPIDDDACFANAGFAQFADTDEAWDSDFHELVELGFASLGTYGEPTASELGAVFRQSLRDRLRGRKPPALSIAETAVLVTHDDQFEPYRVDFGSPARASVTVGDGHPILWIWLHHEVAADAPARLAGIAQRWPLVETVLRWDALLGG